MRLFFSAMRAVPILRNNHLLYCPKGLKDDKKQQKGKKGVEALSCHCQQQTKNNKAHVTLSGRVLPLVGAKFGAKRARPVRILWQAAPGLI